MQNMQHVNQNGVPAVSIIMPAYSVAKYIGAALDSVLAQTFSDYEIIVVNDGSPDTVELERALEPYLERIVYIKQKNRGPSAARNTAILRARGEYVALLDSDDLWMSNYLAEQMKVLHNNPSIDLIYTDALLFGDSNLAGRTFMETAPSCGPVNFESLVQSKCCIITSCTMVRRQLLIDVGLFDENFIRSEDFDLWLRLVLQGGQLTYQRQVLARHRLHGESLASDSARMIDSQIEVLRKIAGTLTLSPWERKLVETQIASCKAHLALERGKSRFASGEYKQAIEFIAYANRFFRTRKLQAALVGMRAAPRLLHCIYLMRHRVSTRKTATVVHTSKSNAQTSI